MATVYIAKVKNPRKSLYQKDEVLYQTAAREVQDAAVRERERTRVCQTGVCSGSKTVAGAGAGCNSGCLCLCAISCAV